MIEAKGLTKQYGTFTAVRDLSFRIETGKTLALVGTSGCGKTTTLKMLNRLVEPTSGEVLVEGKAIGSMPLAALRRQMGYVIQHIGLFPHYTIFENVATVPRLLAWEERKIRQRVFHLLERLGLPASSSEKYPDQLSGGQQQRVGIARALAANPPIILMDEPFGALDPITRQDIRNDFKDLEELSSKTTVMVTHDIQEAFELADLICVLDRGELQQIGTPLELLFEPATDFVRQFLAGKQATLELSEIQLQHLFPHLPASVDVENTIPINPDTSVFKTFNLLGSQPKGKQMASVAVNGLRKVFRLNELMEALQEWKERRRG